MTSRIMIVAAVMCLARAASADPLTCNLHRVQGGAGPHRRRRRRHAHPHLGRRGQPGTAAAAVDQQRHADHPRTVGPHARARRRGRHWRATRPPSSRWSSGLRRATDQQIKPLRDLGVEITSKVIDEIKWEAFWDAPLERARRRMPRTAMRRLRSAASRTSPGCRARPEEVKRATAIYRAQSCDVKSNGGRIEVRFRASSSASSPDASSTPSTKARA